MCDYYNEGVYVQQWSGSQPDKISEDGNTALGENKKVQNINLQKLLKITEIEGTASELCKSAIKYKWG